MRQDVPTKEIPMPPSMQNTALFPAVALKAYAATFNFEGNFKFPQQGFVPLSQANVSEISGKTVERKMPLAIIFEPSR